MIFSVLSLSDCRGHFLGRQDAIFVILDLVALDLLVALDWIAGFAVDEFAANPLPVARLSVLKAMRSEEGGI